MQVFSDYFNQFIILSNGDVVAVENLIDVGNILEKIWVALLKMKKKKSFLIVLDILWTSKLSKDMMRVFVKMV